MESDWFKKIYQTLEQKKELIEPADFRFYNISHLPLLARRTEQLADSCNTCLRNKDILEELSENIDEFLNENIDKRKKFEQAKNKIENHLKREHQLRFPGHFTSVFSLVSIIAGLLCAGLYSWFSNQTFLQTSTLIFVCCFLFAGYFTGKQKDQAVYRKNMQI